MFFRSHQNARSQARRALQPQYGRSIKGGTLNSFLVGFSIGTVLVVATLSFNIFNWPLPTFSSSHPELSGKPSPKEGSRSPHLVFQNAVGAINEALPLGILVNDGSGGETLVLSDLVEGTQLSAGTALSAIRWSIPE